MRTKLNINFGASPLVTTPVMSAVETNNCDGSLMKKKERNVLPEQYLQLLVNKTNRCTEFQFYWYHGSTCFGQPFCQSSSVLSHTSALVHFMQLWWPFATRSRTELHGDCPKHVVIMPIKLEFGASVGFIHKESVMTHGHTIIKVFTTLLTYINPKIWDKEQYFTNSHKKLTWYRTENKHNIVGYAERINIKISTLSFTLPINFHIFKKNSIRNYGHTEHIDSLCSYINFLNCYHSCSYINFLHCYQDTRLPQCLFASILITLVYNLLKTEILWQNTEIETHFNDYFSMTVNLILRDVMSTASNSYCPGQCYIINLCDMFTYFTCIAHFSTRH